MRHFLTAFAGTITAAIMLTVIERIIVQQQEDREERDDMVATFAEEIDEELDDFREGWSQ
jgi:hypothetical protein